MSAVLNRGELHFRIECLSCEECGEVLSVPIEKTAFQVSNAHAEKAHGTRLSNERAFLTRN